MKTRRSKLRSNKTHKKYLGGNETKQAILFDLENKGYYVGNTNSTNQPHDKNGVVLFSNGNLYVGNIKDGQMHGHGTYINIEFQHITNGVWEKNIIKQKMNTLITSNKPLLIDEQNNTAADPPLFNNLYYYFNETNTTNLSGFYVLVYNTSTGIKSTDNKTNILINNGDIYVGNLKEGKFDGKGILYDLKNNYVKGIECNRGKFDKDNVFILKNDGSVMYVGNTSTTEQSSSRKSTEIIHQPTKPVGAKPSNRLNQSQRKTSNNNLNHTNSESIPLIHKILNLINGVCQQTDYTDEQKKDAIQQIVDTNINKLDESPIEGMDLKRYKIYNNDIVQSYLVLIDKEKLLDESIYDKIQTEYIPLKHNKDRGFHLKEEELLSTDFGLFMEKWRELELTRKSPYFFLANLANMGRTLRCYKKKCTLNEPNLKNNKSLQNTIFYNYKYVTDENGNILYTDENGNTLLKDNYGYMFVNKNNEWKISPVKDKDKFNKKTYESQLNTNSNDVNKLFTLWNACLIDFNYDKYVDLYLEYFKYYIKINPDNKDNKLNRDVINNNIKNNIINKDVYTSSNNLYDYLFECIKECKSYLFFIFSHQMPSPVKYVKFLLTRMVVSCVGYVWTESLSSHIVDNVVHDYLNHNNIDYIRYFYNNMVPSEQNKMKKTYDLRVTEFLELFKKVYNDNDNDNMTNLKYLFVLIYYFGFETSYTSYNNVLNSGETISSQYFNVPIETGIHMFMDCFPKYDTEPSTLKLDICDELLNNVNITNFLPKEDEKTNKELIDLSKSMIESNFI